MYDHKNIDKKWQDKWENEGIFHAEDDSDKEKFYCLVEFPYPSGAGLHVGHPRGYTAIDVLARKRKMEGYEVLFPIGWDAFGLPTENYAIKTGRTPQEVTKENIATFKRQLKSLGFSFDWSREINTTDPEYYKWTQWMFLEFFKAGLAYKKKMPINWCPSCKTGLANEEVVNQSCERCGGEVEKKEKEQWMIRITDYAEKLLEGLNDVNYLPKIKKQQEDWIGKSEGAEIIFKVKSSENEIKVFTTRPDTLFGATYMVLAPEHELVSKIVVNEKKEEVQDYIKKVASKTDIERGDDSKEKTGVFTGSYAINPVNGKEIPIWIADYVLTGYGTGAIMAVPAHDERDFMFASKFDLPKVRVVLQGSSGGTENIEKLAGNSISDMLGVEVPYIEKGILVNSGEFNGLSSDDAKEKITAWLENKGVGKKTVNYRLRDWVFSRQRYWGEPIPLVNCEKCGWVPLPIEQLPLELPVVEKYQPTDNGESPLATMTEWVNTTCHLCGGDAKRETDTMPNWAGSSWYFLRYIDPKNGHMFASPEKLRYWMPVDWYNGGMEHTTLHLLYSRFWNKFLFDRGHVPVSEPYMKRTSHGLILAKDNSKMSKTKGNVINPDDIVGEFGADTLRVYELFMGPFAEPVPWNTKGIVGVKRFLDRVSRFNEMIVDTDNEDVVRELHVTIKKVGEDIEEQRYNTAVAKMMEFVNIVYLNNGLTKVSLDKFIRVLCPFAPHLANELYEKNIEEGFVELQKWPEYDENMIVKNEIEIAVQVNGKLRGTIIISTDASESEVLEQAKANKKVAKFLEGGVKKEIYIKKKIVNFVV